MMGKWPSHWLTEDQYEARAEDWRRLFKKTPTAVLCETVNLAWPRSPRRRLIEAAVNSMMSYAKIVED